MNLATRRFCLSLLAPLALVFDARSASGTLVNLGPGSFTPLAPVIAFNEVAVGTQNPSFPFNGLPTLGDITVSFGGHFVGQATSGTTVVTLSDNTPTAPLALAPAAPATFTASDASSPNSPVLSGTPLFNGPVSVFFSKPVAGVALKGGFFNAVNGTSIEAYGADGAVLGRITNSVLEFEFYGLADSTGANVIKGISFFITGAEPFGFAIDDLTFGAAGDIILTPTPTRGPGDCTEQFAEDVPLTIPDSGSVESVLNVPGEGTVTDVDVKFLVADHTYIGDLEVHLISPSGTDRVIVDNVCGSSDDLDVDLDDAAGSAIPCPPIDGLPHTPSQSLAVFNGGAAGGTWRLRVLDTAPGEQGSLLSWGLRICTGGGTPTPTPTITPPVGSDCCITHDEPGCESSPCQNCVCQLVPTAAAAGGMTSAPR